MTPEEFVRRGQAAQRAADEAIAESAYRTMSDAELARLRRAFTLDALASGASADTIAFCAGRIAVIDRIRQERS